MKAIAASTKSFHLIICGCLKKTGHNVILTKVCLYPLIKSECFLDN